MDINTKLLIALQMLLMIRMQRTSAKLQLLQSFVSVKVIYRKKRFLA